MSSYHFIIIPYQQFGTCGGFAWDVHWETNGINGYLVQEITKDFIVNQCQSPPPAVSFTPHYWEAWRVQEDGGIHGTSGPDDHWENPFLDLSGPLVGFP